MLKLGKLIFLLAIIAQTSLVFAGDLPRLATIKKEANMRKGPGEEFPISANYHIAPMPVIILREYNQWREIIDYDGTKGWVNKLLLNDKLSAIVQSNEADLWDSANFDGRKKIATLKRGISGFVKECNQVACLLKINEYQGWVDKSQLWGLSAKP